VTNVRRIATLDENGDVPAEQLGNAGEASHPDLADHNTLGLATQAELDAHTHDYATSASVTTAVSNHAGAADPHTGYLKEADFDDVDFLVGTATGHTGAEIVVGTSPGGELGGTWASPTVDASHSGSTHAATQAAAESTAADALATHAADTTSVHGIADTTVLATDAEVATAVSDHAAAANPHPTYLTQTEGDAAYQPLDSDLTAIAALSTTAFGRSLLALADAAALAAAHSHAGASTTYAPGSFTVATGNYAVMVRRLELTTTQRATLAGTARLRIT
jgi:hypothetical protein